MISFNGLVADLPVHQEHVGYTELDSCCEQSSSMGRPLFQEMVLQEQLSTLERMYECEKDKPTPVPIELELTHFA